MANIVSICNQAIGRLGGTPIISLGDQTKEANLCNINFEHIRDAVLEEYPWTFAIKRFLLPRLEDDDVSAYDHRFEIPAGVLSILWLGDQPDDTIPNDIIWEREGNQLRANATNVYIKTISQIVDPNFWSSMFAQAMAVRLASEIAVALTASVPLQKSLLQEYIGLIEIAAAQDGKQGTTQRIRSTRYIATRQGGGNYIGPTV